MSLGKGTTTGRSREEEGTGLSLFRKLLVTDTVLDIVAIILRYYQGLLQVFFQLR